MVRYIHLAKASGLNLRQLPGVNGTEFLKISKKGATSRGIAKLSTIIL